MKLTQLLNLVLMAALCTSCKASNNDSISDESDPAQHTEEVDGGDEANEVNACIGGEVPVGPQTEAPAANCPDTLSETAAEIQAGFIETATEQIATRTDLLNPEFINVVLCGTGSPIPSPRTQSCTAVFVGGKFFLFDAGDGASRSIEALNLPLINLEAIFLTHFHSDHIAGVGEVVSRSWILGRQSSLEIYGGEGVERITDGFNLIYGIDDAYRVAHHGPEFFPVETARATARLIESPGPAGNVVYEQDGIVIRAFEVDHSPVLPALGFRIEYRDKIIAISGDTSATEGLTNLAQDADILVSDVMNKTFIEETECALAALPPATRGAAIFRDIRTYHIDVDELAETAAEASVQTLALTHLVPIPDNTLEEDALFRAPISAVYPGNIVVGTDGKRLTLELD